MSHTRRAALALYAGATLAFAMLPAASLAASGKTLAYFMAGNGSSNAYLIDWKPSRAKATVTSSLGTQPGSFTDDGTQKLITLAAPLSVTYANLDDCGLDIQQRSDTRQVVVRDLAGGVSQVVEIGTVTNIGGCQDGLVTPFGAPTDPGTSLNRLAMTARPPVNDLVPGTQLAGFSEELPPPGDLQTSADIVTLQADGTALFQATGHAVPAAFDANQWLVFSLAGQPRAYTRVAVDTRTGGETWLKADWAGGVPTRVEQALVVKPLAGAGFGTVADASRMWNSGIFIATRKPFLFYLYRNGTGERVQQDLDLGTESRSPIDAWGFDGINLVQHRLRCGGSCSFDRTWVPLRNEGGKTRWVMESEVVVTPSGTTVAIKPRVNYYVDTGKAVPLSASVMSAGMVYLGEKPRLPR